MKVKGMAFLARQALAMAEQGAAEWNAFLRDFARKEPVFAEAVHPVSQLPADAWVRLNEAYVERFHGGDTRAWWHFGKASAQFALRMGQLQGLFEPGEARRFLEFTPGIWRAYFDGGELDAFPRPGYVELHLRGVPHPHPYFEFSIMGYAVGGAEVLLGQVVRYEALDGFSMGGREVRYRLFVD